MPRILVADDQADVLAALCLLLKGEGYAIQTAASPAGVLKTIETQEIDVVLIDQPDEEACGTGETAITVVAAAIGNAIFDATGARLREVPFTPDRVKAALARRG